MIVSIVTPTLNAASFITSCIDSVRANGNPRVDVEHVIVDAGSTDGTVEIAQKYGLRVLQGKDKGIFDAINKGSFVASGDLLGFLGADDLLLEGAMNALLSNYEKGRDRWLCGGIQWIDSNAASLGYVAAPPPWITTPVFASLGWCCIGHMATYLTRDFFHQLGGFDISFRVAGDYEMFSRAMSITSFKRIGQPLAAYRRTGFNHSSTHADLAEFDRPRVSERFAPRSSAERALYRSALKVWLNARNPRWCAHKFVSRVSEGAVRSKGKAEYVGS